MDVTHEELRKVAMAHLKRARYNNKTREVDGFGCSIVLSELVSAGSEIPDAIGWRYGRSILIECKVSRSDFLADGKKPHRMSGTGAGEQRYFLTPKGLISKLDLPPDWGLLELEGRSIEQIVKAPLRELDTNGHQREKTMLLSTIRRIRTREFLMISAEQVEEYLEA